MDMIEKIASLRKKIPENGATEEEALAALAIAAKLMEKHGITEEDLKNVEFTRDMREGGFQQKQKIIHPSQKYCGSLIGVWCGVQIWSWNPRPKENATRMFGLKGDVEMAEFLLTLIHDSMNRGWKEFLANNPKRPDVTRHTEYWSFMIGFADTVNDKIRSFLEVRREAAEQEAVRTGTDLVTIKTDLVLEGMATMLPGIKLKDSPKSTTKITGDAFGSGQQAGHKVNLSRPVGGASSGSRRLG